MGAKHVAVLLAAALAADCLPVYSSFWAPLFDPYLLNYRVDAPFAPDAGRAARDLFQGRYGPRGADLVADLGNGKGPGEYVRDKGRADVRLVYTYPGAELANAHHDYT